LSLPSPTPDFTPISQHCTPPPIPASSYHSRLAQLTSTLSSLNASAYILEPSPSSLYYLNVSLSSWGLSERPLLLIIPRSGPIRVLTPKFEAPRARLLPLPVQAEYVLWEEEEDPYAAAVAALPQGRLLADGTTRLFVVDGLGRTGRTVELAPPAIQSIRERKTEEELEILRCANERTLLAIRAVRGLLRFGMRESQGRALMGQALAQAGLKDLDNIFLVGENAALPHGRGTDRVIGKSDFVLIDCGGSLHGYHSDVTRTFALPGSEIPSSHLQLWYSVQHAQSLALLAAHPGAPAHTIDAAARSYLNTSHLGPYFTHRVGHGIGLEVHESPYLVASNPRAVQVGNTFSDEPGVYVLGKMGVRLEDCFEVLGLGVEGQEEGGRVLTLGVGGLARSPWDI
ncbi:Creatinase/aminopeptidase, partial [Dacryopinax primogenitus]